MNAPRPQHRSPQPIVAALALGTALLALAASAAAVPSAISIPRQATVGDEVVRLRDVAELTGTATELGDVELGRAPAPGESARLSGESILRHLRQAGLDEVSIVYTIPAWVRLVRAFQEIPEQEIREAVRAKVELGLAAGETIEEIGVPQSARVPLGSYALEVDEPHAAGTGRARRAEVRVVQNGDVTARVQARVALAAVGPVVIARNPVERGAVVRSEDVIVEERSLAGLPASLFTDPAEVIGKEARVAIAAGRPIAASSLAARSLVRKGDTVRLRLESAGLRLTAAGQAMEDGGVGDPVRVVNPSSGKELTGRVVAHGIVVVSQ